MTKKLRNDIAFELGCTYDSNLKDQIEVFVQMFEDYAKAEVQKELEKLQILGDTSAPPINEQYLADLRAENERLQNELYKLQKKSKNDT